MKARLILMLFILITGFSSSPALSQTEFSNPRGFIDTNHDGINDWFRDANGDGINDIDKKPYKHLFEFVDSDGDGINDFYRDIDGDGVNDLLRMVRSSHPEMRERNVVDFNKDWINDITGIIYNRRNLRGSRFGKVLEEYGQELQKFVDEDGDGQFDGMWEKRSDNPRMDHFIDRDGDGMCDGRGFYRHKHGGMHKKGNRP